MKRTQHTSQEKAKIVIEALRGEKAINEIASENNIHPNMLSKWKKEAMEGLYTIFESENSKIRKQQKGYEEEIDSLYTQIGKLTTQIEWLKKKSGF